MNFSPLPDDWPDQRDTLHFLAAHLLAQARQRHDGLFDLVPQPGRLRDAARRARPRRVRLVGGSMFVERVTGETIRDARGHDVGHPGRGEQPRPSCATRSGSSRDPDFWVGDDTPPFRDPDAPDPTRRAGDIDPRRVVPARPASDRRGGRLAARTPRRRSVGSGRSTSTTASTSMPHPVCAATSARPAATGSTPSRTSTSARTGPERPGATDLLERTVRRRARLRRHRRRPTTRSAPPSSSS